MVSLTAVFLGASAVACIHLLVFVMALEVTSWEAGRTGLCIWERKHGCVSSVMFWECSEGWWYLSSGPGAGFNVELLDEVAKPVTYGCRWKLGVFMRDGE